MDRELDIIVDNSELKIQKEKLGALNYLVVYMASKIYLKPFYKIMSLILHILIPKDSFQKKLRLPHPFNIIINSNASIGKNITIYQNCTIGSSQFGKRKGVPHIDDNVIIYPNSVLIGNIKIGKNSIIAAGSVVIKDVPEFTVWGGNPARCLGYINNNHSETKLSPNTKGFEIWVI